MRLSDNLIIIPNKHIVLKMFISEKINSTMMKQALIICMLAILVMSMVMLAAEAMDCTGIHCGMPRCIEPLKMHYNKEKSCCPYCA